MPESEKSSVPRFASFRPKPTAGVNKEQGDCHGNRSLRPRDNLRDELAEPSRHELEKTSNSRKSDSVLHEKRKAKHELHSKGLKSHAASAQTYNEVFKADLHGDVKNVQYGNLHRYSIPQYRRIGVGFVLGLERLARIDRSSEDLVLTSPIATTVGRLRHEDKRWKEAKAFRLVRAREDEEPLDVRQDFVPLSKGKKRKRSGGDDRSKDAMEFEDMQDHDRMIVISSDSDLEPSEAVSTDKGDQETKEKTVRLHREVVERPAELNSWLNLIDHQEEILLGQHGGQRALTSSEKYALADVRSSIYEQAIKAVNNEDSRVTLIARQMDEVTEIWDTTQLSKRWEDLLNRYPHSVELQMQYLDFLQTHFTVFQFEECCSVFIRVLSNLSFHIEQPRVVKDKLRDLEGQYCYVFLRLTFMFRDAGYHELATALWQAILEFTFFTPQRLRNVSVTERLSAFEDFWESEAPRIGEPGALGWCNNNDSCEPPDRITLPTKDAPTGDPFTVFAEEEARQVKILHHPGRTSDEVEIDDPYHVILFSDIKKFLSCIPPNMSQVGLVQGYLRFTGLPPLLGGDWKMTRKWALDPFLQGVILTDSTVMSNPLRAACFVQTTETLFNTAFDLVDFTEDVSWLERTLAKLVETTAAGDALAEYYLAFLLRYGPSDDNSTNAVRAAKALLKKSPTSLNLYNAFGIIEARTRPSKSYKVFSTALAMRKSLPSSSESDAILLWRTWAWESLRARDMRGALEILLMVGKLPSGASDLNSGRGVDESPANLLRGRTTLTDLRDHALALGMTHHVVLATDCLALMSYLRSDDRWDLDAALAVYRDTEGKLDEAGRPDTLAYENLHQARTQLLMYHISHSHHYRPAIIRKDLQDSLRRFPHNTIILSAYASVEARFRIDDRVRSAVSEILVSREMGRKQESIVTHAFAIASEMQRVQNSTGTIHAVRAAFRRASESTTCMHSPAFWFAYLRFELCHDDGGLESGRRVFGEGMRKLPWCKGFMMEAFGTILRQGTADDQLLHIFNVMEEKGLRVLVDLHKLLEQTRP